MALKSEHTRTPAVHGENRRVTSATSQVSPPGRSPHADLSPTC